MRRVKANVKLQIPAGKATPAPPIGPALGQHGLNISEFCQKFNEATKNKIGNIIPVEITVFEDRTFEFKLKSPPVASLLKKMAGVEKGSGEASRKRIGKVTREQIKEIAKIKLEDLNTNDIEKAKRIIEGTAKSMGIVIE